MKHINLLKRDSLFALATELRLAGVHHKIVRASAGSRKGLRGAVSVPHGELVTALFGDTEYDGSLTSESTRERDHHLRQTYARHLVALLASVRDVTYHLQNAHWTVKSSSFAEHHKFFNDAYDLFWEMQDTVAEHIRAYDITTLIPNNPDGLRAFSWINIRDIEAAVPNRHGIETRFQMHMNYYHAFLDTLANLLKVLVKQSRTPVIDDIAGDALFSELLGVVAKQRWFTRSYETNDDESRFFDRAAPDVDFVPNPKFTARVDFRAEKLKQAAIEKAGLSKK